MCPVQKYTLHMLARYLPGEISGMSQPFRIFHLFARLVVPAAKTWLDHEEMLYMEDKRQGHSPHFIRDRHGNNYEIMMVMIRVLKPGLLVDKEYISFIY